MPTQTTTTQRTPNPVVPVFNYDHYETNLEAIAADYSTQKPFPHLAMDGWLIQEAARTAAREFPLEANDHWIRYRHVNENKASTHHWEDFPPTIRAIIEEMNSPRFLTLISRITGIEGLRADPNIEGGGMHQSWSSGFLNVHTDFTMHRDQPTWRRRCNLILYLNEAWDPSWGGALQLWDSKMKDQIKKVDCLLNRAVLFNTPRALHGFPDPLTCPDGQSRKSLQWYYYTEDQATMQEEEPAATTYFARPTDSAAKKAAVWADNMALRAYSAAKRKFGISDTAVSTVMSMLSPRKQKK